VTAEQLDLDIPEFIPTGCPRSVKKENAKALLPFRRNGKQMVLSAQLEDTEDGKVIIRLDLEDLTASAHPFEEDYGAPMTKRPKTKTHFCAIILDPDRILQHAHTGEAKPVTPPEVL